MPENNEMAGTVCWPVKHSSSALSMSGKSRPARDKEIFSKLVNVDGARLRPGLASWQNLASNDKCTAQKTLLFVRRATCGHRWRGLTFKTLFAAHA